MRRKDREITDIREILDIVNRCAYCTLALDGGEYPYAVPVNFGWRWDGGVLRLYIHSASAGTKLELLRKNPRAGFAMSVPGRLLTGEVSCEWGMTFESVCGSGIVRVLEGGEKLTGLRAVMEHYNPGGTHTFAPEAVKATTVLELTARTFSGKRKAD